MGEFELLERDGLARIGRFPTPHGTIETPALLPVVHPDPTRQPVAPQELRRRFGLGAVITSSYIAYRTPALREKAEASGIHGLLGFDGPVMTDSGAFQQHAYGHVEVGPAEILGFQRRIGSDIATVLDLFGEPGDDEAKCAAGVDETTRRARAARADHRGLLAVPVQGGRFAELRLRSAQEASETGDILAVGGVVPLMEQYRFADLARALIAARPGLAPEKVVHLFGTGHPMTFAFAALFGVDLFDSSSYHKFARRGSLMFPHGTIAVDELRENLCRCALCAEVPLPQVARLPETERVRRIAEHNLLTCATEVANVRQAIRDGTLWELAERRAAAHPALQAGLRSAVRGTRIFLATEPESRRSFRHVGATSGLRPAVIRFLARVQRWKERRPAARTHPWVPLVPARLEHTPATDRSGAPIAWDVFTGLGPVPLELTELYPVGCYVGVEEFEGESGRRGPAREDDAASLDLEGVDVDREQDWAPAWDRRQLTALLEFAYTVPVAEKLLAASLAPQRSHRTGRLRNVLHEGRIAFTVGNDGVPRPTWHGAQLLHSVAPYPARRILVAPDAEEFVAGGRSLFSKFVRGGDSSLVPGASALLVDADDHLLAVGRLGLAPGEMARIPRAVAVRVTAHAHHPVPAEEPEPAPVAAPLPPPDVP